MATESKSVCVIGGGPSGLYMLKHALEQGDWACTLFERADDIGGIWKFTPDKGSPSSKDPFPSPIHRDLVMNAAKQACQFLDHPWPENLPTFPTRSDAFDYLSNYADKYNLRDHIKLNQEIVLVEPADSADRTGTKWRVTTKCTKTGKSTHYSFDTVVVCTGIEMKPKAPNIDNLGVFQGKVSVAAEYLEPSPFKGKRVLIRSSGPSGLDLMIHLRNVASELFLSTNKSGHLFEVCVPANVKMVSPIKSATKSGFILEDGTELADIDCLIFASGYQFDYKFMSPSCGLEITNDNKIVRPLYRYMVNTKYPGLCFVGVTAYTPAFYACSIQVKWLVKVLKGEITLPSETEMNPEIESSQILPGHNIYPFQWDYFSKLAQEAEITLLPYVEKLFVYNITRHFEDSVNYRKDSYQQVDENSFEIEPYKPEEVTSF